MKIAKKKGPLTLSCLSVQVCTTTFENSLLQQKSTQNVRQGLVLKIKDRHNAEKITESLGLTTFCTHPLKKRQILHNFWNVHNIEFGFFVIFISPEIMPVIKIWSHILKSKKADLIWRIEIAKFNLTRMKLGILRFFGSLIPKLKVKLQKFKMTYRIWKTEITK